MLARPVDLRVVENATDDTWRNVRNELDRMHLVTLATADGQVAQRSTLTPGRKPSWARSNSPNPHGPSTSQSPPTDRRLRPTVAPNEYVPPTSAADMESYELLVAEGVVVSQARKDDSALGVGVDHR